jgi:peptidoglycan/LPS O-acetylase OafA/YrhL
MTIETINTPDHEAPILTAPLKRGDHFFPALEGLRGVLALTVALGHSMIWLRVDGNPTLYGHPSIWGLRSSGEILARLLLFFGDGPAAVSAFFVLSGVVLSGSLLRHLRDVRGQTGAPASRGADLLHLYRYYVSQRIFRIFPLHLVVVAIVAAIMLHVRPSANPLASDWYRFWYPQKPGLAEFLENAALLSPTLNSVTWSLYHEFYVCAVLPLFVHYCRLARPRTLLLIGVLLMAASIFSRAFLTTIPWGKNPLEYLFLFYIGAAFMLRADELSRLEPNKWSSSSLVSLGVLCSIPFARLITSNDNAIFVYESVAASTLIIIAMQPQRNLLKLILNYPWLRDLGRMSFGFYLCHFPILYLFVTVILDYAPDAFLIHHPVATMFGSFLASSALTWLACRCFAYPLERWSTTKRRELFAA